MIKDLIGAVSTSTKQLFIVSMFSFFLSSCGSDSNKNKTSDTRPISVAHMWNEAMLSAIRLDRVRPPVQARNLFHISAAMYDAWALYDKTHSTYLAGKSLRDFNCPISVNIASKDSQPAREEALSYAAYRIIKHRYVQSPGYATTVEAIDRLMRDLGYDPTFTSKDLSRFSRPAVLGNYIADCYINYGLADGSNEAGSHAYQFYRPVNTVPLVPRLPGNPNMIDLDHWQPLALTVFIDQGGTVIPGGAATHLAPEWGKVFPFSFTDEQKTTYNRDDTTYPVYLDPGNPPSIYGNLAQEYQWTFALVVKWSSHLDPTDGVMVDISPASIGNLSYLPPTFAEHHQFYDDLQGGDRSPGHKLNPVTQQPYTPQRVPRGDYTRVLAEFWADGPSSETPPGHWFSIFNKISSDPQLEKRFRGVGRDLGTLEWDVKGYFALGGAMHDAAIAAWGVKGWYDYVRPIAAIRAMADLGQSSNPALPRYNAKGLPLEAGYIELIQSGDPLAGPNNEHVGKIKVKAWRGPKFINNPAIEMAGVDWILAENWWAYQRPSFVTPPFAGYVSGHSTYSRAAAEVLTAITGDPFFPGGMGSFQAKKNEYLVFEEGPSVDVTLQWATYRDAADQCSLSRIWGGIHPPVDDIPGRLIGEKIGIQAVDFAERYYQGVGN